MAAATKRTKRIFISDLHLNDKRSLEVLPSYKFRYFWISPERTELLATFLEKEVLESADVKELIILGDLFDQWVVPTIPPPNIDFDAVYFNPQNKEVVENLNKIIKHPEIDVYYTPGNHDLLLDKTAIEKYFPGIHFCEGSQKYVGVYLKDGIGAEHCNQYNFFCAPNPVPQDNQYLPTGFFLSRYGSEQKAHNMKSPNFLEILKNFVNNLFKKDKNGNAEFIKKGDAELIKNMMLSVAESVGLKESSLIQLDGIGNFDNQMTVRQVAEMYCDAMTRWDHVKPNGLSAIEAISTEVTGYSGFANTQYYKQKKARVIVFGHTHDAMLQGYSVDANGIQHMVEENGCDYIYANSGTWIDNHPCSFIETEIKGNCHYVTWFQYTDDGKKKMEKQRYIILK